MEIALAALEITNFKSFTTATRVEFPHLPGFRLLGGANELEPQLGPNGAGKSSLWDALFFCLYGVSVRGQKASDITSWGAKRCEVKASILFNGVLFIVRRLGSPNVLTIDDEPASQEEVEQVVGGLTRERFLHAVMFGQGSPRFLDLAMPARADLLDEVLDLGRWLKLSEKATQRCKLLTAQANDYERFASFAEGKLAGLEDEEQIKRLSAIWERERQARIEAAIVLVEKAEQEAEDAKAKADAAHKALKALPSIKDPQDRLAAVHEAMTEVETSYRVLTQHRARLAERCKHFDTLDTMTCDQCEQGVPVTHSIRLNKHYTRNLREVEADIKECHARTKRLTAERNDLTEEVNKLVRKRDFHVQQLRDAEAVVTSADRRVVELSADVDRIGEGEKNPHMDRLARVQAARLAATSDRDEARAKADALKAEYDLVDYWRAGFKRVRLFLMKRVLSHLELEVANAASALGLPDWKIAFATEVETKSNTLKPGVHVSVSSPIASGAWESWSGGEGQRITLAVTIGFANLIQRMAGVTFAWEVWDEPTNFLSEQGVEDLMQALAYRAESELRSVWLVDHRALSHSGFDEIWRVRKTRDGSIVEIVAAAD